MKKNQQRILFAVALILIGGAALALAEFKAHQRLGKPGIKATALPGEVRMEIALPENVLDFSSTNIPESDVELGYFPKDTSYARRCYFPATNGWPIYGTIVMMGADRTSIHRPDYCLEGQGWKVLSRDVAKVPIGGATSQELPVSKWVLSRTFQTPDGRTRSVGAIYTFWFVADGEETPSHYQRLWWLTRDLLSRGVLQRWAYVSFFTACEPGQEEAAAARLEKLISAAVPEFQNPLAAPSATAIAPPGKT